MNEYDIIMEVAGSCHFHIKADTEEEARAKANYLCQEGDFGLLEEIEWEVKHCTRE